MINRANPTPATRQSWSSIQPLPAQRAPLALERVFSEQEVEAIRLGLIPDRMEDKWFIFFEEDTLYVHRSWTGYCIYQLRLREDGAQYTVVDAFVNRDPSQYSGTDDGYDERLLLFLVENFLLGRRYRLPMAANVPAGIVTELYHHHIIGAGPKAEATPERKSKRGWLWRWLTRG